MIKDSFHGGKVVRTQVDFCELGVQPNRKFPVRVALPTIFFDLKEVVEYFVKVPIGLLQPNRVEQYIYSLF